MLSRSRTHIGLDIGSSHIKVTELAYAKKIPRLVNFGISPLISDAIVDGEVMDRPVVVETVRTLLDSRGINGREVTSAISGRGVIVKRITMEKMKESEARKQIRWEAEQHVPYDIRDVSLDFEIVNPDVGESQMEVMLVAAKSEKVTAHVSLLKEIGLIPLALDVGAFAVQNSFETSYETLPGELIALVHVGAELTNINFLVDGMSYFSRDIPTASNDCSERIQRTLGLSKDKAHIILRGGEVEESLSDRKLQKVFGSFAEDMAVGIERALPYLPGDSERVDRMFLSGGGATIPSLATNLHERFQIPVEIMNPLNGIEYDPELFAGHSVEQIAPALALALGLSLRGE